MKSHIAGLRVASIVFGVIAFLQLMRIAIRPEVLVAGYSMPLWPSVVAVILFGGLSFWMWHLTRSPSN